MSDKKTTTPEVGSDKKPGTISLEETRLSQDYSTLAKAKKLLMHVPVRRPPKHQFFRVHPSEEYRHECAVVEIDGEDTYLVHPSAVPYLDTARPVRLVLYVTRHGVPALWAIKLPTEDGKTNSWNNSAADAADIAMEKWVRLVSNRENGAYDVIVAEGIPTEPTWPDKSMEELLQKAFRDKYIDSEEHPLLRELLGLG